MATFAKSTFNAQLYSASRPTYPSHLYDFIFRYHESGAAFRSKRPGGGPRQCWQHAVDLGCGTGQATINLLRFSQVTAVDPSKKMIEAGRKYIDEELSRQERKWLKKRFKFVQSPAENLSFLMKNSIDLVVAAQAAHWFDWERLWLELARVLRPYGTVAIWGYSEMRLTRYPSLTPLIDAYTHGTDRATSLGPHWQQPGRSIVENLLRDIPNPNPITQGQFHSERRIYFSGSHFPDISYPRPVVLRKKMSWDGFEAYLRSFSSLNNFQAEYPDDAKHPDGDIVQRFLKTLKDGMRDVDNRQFQDDLDSEQVEIEWPLALMLAKKV
ncbi:TMT1 [Sanghuangporus vaninii]